MELADKIAIVTGASSGLGEVFARKLAQRGYRLILVARRAGRLEELRTNLEHTAHAAVECFPCDLASTQDTERLAAHLEQRPVELLVNNAGFGTLGRFVDTDYSRQVDMVNVHVLATMRLTKAVLPGMMQRGHGGIINVASVAGFWRSAGNVSYCATKGWINDFTEGLRVELDSAGSAVNVQALCPGFTYTEFHDTMGADRAAIPKALWMPADYVVEESLKGLEAGRLFVIPNWKYRLGAAFGELLPWRWRVKLEKASPHKRDTSR
ncbi:SDR family oxidoreductase [uncultured Paludibaculum sp.]|uniref:SDR family NAD(P)-dependent oxidoreductase n=1 Tax=uncultured Paludibaculum sp. TaxID=1765020 RepID=UPI002AAA9C2C|nr:SDR family oxidoreductase [uncultured Paludibaculum sp.]